MKKLLYVLIILAIALLAVTCVKNDNAIIVYSCLEQFRNEELQKQLNEKFPDDEIYVMYTPTAKAAAKLLIEGDKTDADIVIALENAYMTKVEQYMADCSKYSHLDFLEDTKSKSNKYVTWERFSGSIVVNKDILDKYNLPIPHTYEDLLNPIYENKIAMPDPKSSGTGFFFLQNLVNVLGEEEAFDYFDKLSSNVKQFTESGSGPIKLLVQGEIAIGLALTFQGVNELNKGNNFIILEPEFGCPYSLNSVSIINGKEKNSKIEQVFEFIVNDFMIYDKTYFSPEKVFTTQQSSMDNYPKNIKYADMTNIDNMEEKERLLSKWKF